MDLREDGKVARLFECAREDASFFEVALGDAAVPLKAEVDDCPSVFICLSPGLMLVVNLNNTPSSDVNSQLNI